MEKTNIVMLGLLLGSSALRTFTDSFVTGLLFSYSIKVAGESVAALTSSLSLLLTFIFSPLIGTFIDKKFFSPQVSGGLYMFTGILMPLFLINFNFLFVFYGNLFFLVLFNIPASLYLASWSSLHFKGKPATGYALLASVNTFFGLSGSIIGSYLVQNEIFWLWVDFKFISSIFVGILLIFIFKNVDVKVFGQNNKKIINGENGKELKNVQILSTTNKGMYGSPFLNYRFFRESIIKKLKSVDRFVIIFGICIIFFSIARTFFLTNVAFSVFNIFDKNLFLYSLVINTAALTAFLFYPIAGKLADFVGVWYFYALGVLLTPFYLFSFILFTDNIILIILWALPMGVITDVSSIGVISLITKPEERNSAIGLITSSGALGSVIGAFFLSIAVTNSFIMNLSLFITIVIPFLLLFPLFIIRRKILSTSHI